MSGNNINTVYVGNLPKDTTSREAHRLFEHYGDIIDVEIRTRSSYCFAFIKFKDYRDAAEVVHCERKKCWLGHNRLMVQLARSSRGNGSSSGNHAFRDSYIGTSHHLECQVQVTGLPSSAEARELKEHMEQAGKVCFSEVRHKSNETIGIVEFMDEKNMEFAAKMLTNSEFINFYSRAYIIVKPYNNEDWPSPRNPSQSRSRSWSRSRSRSRTRTRSRSRSRSHSHSRSRSRSRSRRHRQSQTGSRSRTRTPSRSRSRSRRHRQSQTRSRSRTRTPSRSRSRSRRHRQSQTRSRSRTRTPSRSDDRHKSRSARSRFQ